MTTVEPPRPLDIGTLRSKYLVERDKRVRPDGVDQYIKVAGAHAHFADDPYSPPVEREPLRDEVTVAVIGGGFAGLIVGAELAKAGVTDVRIIERGGDVGGTWYWNRYPGAQCDVESYVYLPMLEETGYVPTEKYAHGPEIAEHCRRVARHFGLYDNACFGTTVTGLEWDDVAARWIVRTDHDDAMRARFVVMGTGPLQRPKLPGVPGIETFAGHSFHTSRWDYDYTGGDSTGGLDRLGDKRVGIIGTGATAVQAVPHLGRHAGELYVFQRTPSSIDVRGNRPTDEEWAAGLQPGWQQQRIDNFTTLTSGGIAPEDLVMDGWTDIAGRVFRRLTADPEAVIDADTLLATFDRCDYEKMDQIRGRVDEIVRDPATAEALKPWYRLLCKRPCFHDEYLQTFNRPTVHLVDTDGKGVERITARGVVVAGTEYPLDCLIYATGFEVGTDYTRRAGYDLVGRDGRLLSEHWVDGMRTLHGMHAHGFPNVFVVGHAQAGFTASYPHLLSEGAKHAAYLVAHAAEHNIAAYEATAEAEEAWVQIILASAGPWGGLGSNPDCTPGYYNNEGQPNDKVRQSGFYPGGPLQYFALLAGWRDAGTLEGLTVR